MTKTGLPAEAGLRPPRRTWIFAGLGLALALAAQASQWPDGAWANVGTLIGGFVVVASVLLWFLFCPGFARWLRGGLAAALAVLVGLGLALVEVEGVDGNLVPRFKWRFSLRADQRLVPAQAETPGIAADLATTGPNDYPGFLGPGRDGRVPQVELWPDWTSKPPRLVWRRPIGAGWSAFAVVNGYAVTLEQRDAQELVTCYEVRSNDPGGRLLWSHGITARHSTTLGGTGPRSTPTIAGGRVFALGATGVLRCLDGASGRLLWSHDLLAESGLTPAEDEQQVAWGRAGSPLVVGELVVVPAGGRPGATRSLAAFHTATGQPAWSGGRHQVAYASPALATLGGRQQIVIVNQDFITGHDPADGRELWSIDWDGPSNSSANTSQAQPIGGDRLLVTKGYGGGARVFAVRHVGGGWAAQTLLANATALRTKLTNVVVHQGHAYGLSDGILQCVDLSTLSARWKRGRYGHGQTMLVGNLLLIQADTGEVVLVAADPQRHLELGRFQAIEGNTWNNPALWGPYLLVRNGEEAACYELPLAGGP